MNVFKTLMEKSGSAASPAWLALHSLKLSNSEWTKWVHLIARAMGDKPELTPWGLFALVSHLSDCVVLTGLGRSHFIAGTVGAPWLMNQSTAPSNGLLESVLTGTPWNAKFVSLFIEKIHEVFAAQDNERQLDEGEMSYHLAFMGKEHKGKTSERKWLAWKMQAPIGLLKKATKQAKLKDMTAELVTSESIKGAWGTLNLTELIEVFNSVEYWGNALVAPDVIMSAMTVAIAISKNNGTTATWLDRRMTTLRQQANASYLVNPVDIPKFTAVYLPSNVNAQDLYSTIHLLWTMGETSGLQVISWILEQARGANCTSITSIASIIRDSSAITYTVLSSVLNLKAQIDAALIAMAAVGSVPYASIRSPLTNVSKYPDLAYIMNKVFMPKEGYSGRRHPQCTLAQDALDGVVSNIQKITRAGGESALAIQKILDAYNIHGVESFSNPGHVYIWAEGVVHTDDVSGSTGEFSHEGKVCDITTMKERDLANDAMIRLVHINSLQDKLCNNNDSAAKVIARFYLDNTHQKKLEGFNTSFYNILTAEVTAALATLNLPATAIDALKPTEGKFTIGSVAKQTLDTYA